MWCGCSLELTISKISKYYNLRHVISPSLSLVELKLYTLTQLTNLIGNNNLKLGNIKVIKGFIFIYSYCAVYPFLTTGRSSWSLKIVIGI